MSPIRLPQHDEEIPGFLADLGIPGIADIHVHFLPEAMQRKVWAVFDRAGEHYGKPWPITYRLGEAERLDRLRDMGIRRFTSLVYAHKPGMAAWLNDWSLAFAAAVPGCTPTATFFPEPEAPAYVAEAIAAGAQVFKLHLEVGGFDPRDPLLEPVWELCAQSATAVVVHCGSGPLPGRHTGPGPIAEVIRRHRGLRIVVAHMGTPEYEDFVALAEAHPGVHLDTTMAGTDFVEEMAPFPARLAARVGALADAGKVVFGSDFPSIPYAYAHQIEVLPRLGIDSEQRLRSVLWEAGSTLMGAASAGSAW